MKRGWQRLVSLLLAVMLAGVMAACNESPEASAGNSEAEAVPVVAFTVAPRELSRRLSLAAMVEAQQPLRVHARGSGHLQALAVEEGDRVSAGQLLASLDLTEEAAELARADALGEEAALNYRRASELFERNSLSNAEYQQARAALKVAESEQALWQARLDFGRIRSPGDGIITGRYVESGEYVRDQDLLFTLADMQRLVVRFAVSELDAAQLQPGASLALEVDALPGMTLEGQIRRVFPAADPDSRRVPVEVSLPGDSFERGVRPGYLVRLDTRIDRRDNVLAVPARAVGREGTDDQGPFVYLIRDQQLVRQSVTEGLVRGNWTEITEGLKAGDEILASNPRDRQAEEKVRIVERWDES